MLHIYDPASGVIVVVAVNSAVDGAHDELPALVVQALQTVKGGNVSPSRAAG